MGVPPTTLADAVRRLDERGEIERLPNPADGRSHLLTLSPAGRERVEAAAPAVWSGRRRSGLREWTCAPTRRLLANGVAAADGALWLLDSVAGLLLRLPA
jgi:DNA-binding MarR family transcriptional regulator